MKSLTKIIYASVFFLALFSQSCEKENLGPQIAVSEQAQQYFEILSTAEAETGIELGLTAADLQAALDAPEQGVAKIEICCYTASDLSNFLGCFGLSTSPCIDEWDFNGDGTVNAADLLIFLANYGCVDVDPLLLTPVSIFVTDMATGQIRNETLIDNASWYLNYPVGIFDQVRWYYDGVFVSSTPDFLQLEYPGATDYDVAIDCNSGLHLVELYVQVDCEVYSTSACVKIGIDESIPFCKTNYCTQ